MALKFKISHILAVLLMAFALPAGGAPTAAQAIFEKATQLYDKGQNVQSLDLYIKGMEMAQREDDKLIYLRCAGYIGNIYSKYDDNQSSLYYWQKGYEMAKEIGANNEQASGLLNIVLAYSDLGETDKARKYLALARQVPDATTMRELYYIYCEACIASGDKHYDKAIALHRKAADFAISHKLPELYVVLQENKIGEAMLQLGQWQQAMKQGEMCLARGRELNYPDAVESAYEILAGANAQLGNTQAANAWRQRYHALHDSLYNRSEFNEIKIKLQQYQDRVHDQQVSLLNSQIKRQVVVIVLVALCLLLALVMAWTVHRSNKRMRATQRLLISKNDELQNATKLQKSLLDKYTALLPENEPDQQQEQPTATISGEQADILLKRVMAVMDDPSYTSRPDFSLAHLAEAVESNTKYVSLVINDNYHKNFKTLLNEQRIQMAVARLTDTANYGNFTIQTIFREVGYTNATSFIRAFKRIMGMPPSDYLRLAQSQQQGS